jgi:hypothetical protein
MTNSGRYFHSNACSFLAEFDPTPPSVEVHATEGRKLQEPFCSIAESRAIHTLAIFGHGSIQFARRYAPDDL